MDGKQEVCFSVLILIHAEVRNPLSTVYRQNKHICKYMYIYKCSASFII